MASDHGGPGCHPGHDDVNDLPGRTLRHQESGYGLIARIVPFYQRFHTRQGVDELDRIAFRNLS